jgi:hypothetical protein
MKMKVVWMVCVVGLAFAVAAAALGFALRPHNFNDCLLKYAPKAHTQGGVATVYRACQAEFPHAAP